jgi:large subunit ribosomal protein L30
MSEEKKDEKKKGKETSANDPDRTVSLKLHGDGEAKAATRSTPPPSSPSKQPSAAAKAAAPKAPVAAKAAASKASAPAAAQKSSGTVRIRQTKSGICAPVDQKQTLFGLGLRRIRHEVVRPDTPAVRGQIHKVRHLVEVVESGAAR